MLGKCLLYQLCDDSCADSFTSLAQCEAQTLGHGNGINELNLHGGIVPGHHHLHVLGQEARPRHVGRAEEKLRPVKGCGVRGEWGMRGGGQREERRGRVLSAGVLPVCV